MEVIAVEEGIKRVVNNKKLFLRLLTNFKGRSMVMQIIETAKAGDFDAGEKASHALKGVAANLAMHQLAAAASQAEESMKAGTAINGLEAELLSCLEAVEAAIADILAEG